MVLFVLFSVVFQSNLSLYCVFALLIIIYGMVYREPNCCFMLLPMKSKEEEAVLLLLLETGGAQPLLLPALLGPPRFIPPKALPMASMR